MRVDGGRQEYGAYVSREATPLDGRDTAVR